MIRYRRLYESENSDIKLYDVVRCAGYEWYVIDKQGDVVTLLAKDDVFGLCVFSYDNSKIYKDSEVRKYLKNSVLPKLQKANPISTRLNDVEVADKIWLLSTGDARELPLEIREFDNSWWLRSPGWAESRVVYVNNDGGIYPFGRNVASDNRAMRPAMRVHVEDLD